MDHKNLFTKILSDTVLLINMPSNESMVVMSRVLRDKIGSTIRPKSSLFLMHTWIFFRIALDITLGITRKKGKIASSNLCWDHRLHMRRGKVSACDHKLSSCDSQHDPKCDPNEYEYGTS